LNVGENTAVNFTFYPNPSVDKIYISNSHDIIGIEIFDLMGKSILKKKGSGKSNTVDISAISIGNYFLKVTSHIGTSVKQFVVPR